MVGKEDLYIRNVKTLAETTTSILIKHGSIEECYDGDQEPPGEIDDERVIDGQGRLVTPTFSEPHIHLDASLTAGDPRWNDRGTLENGINIWADYKEGITTEDVRSRATEAAKWLAVHGVTRIRTHADTTEKSLSTVDGLLAVQDDLSDLVDIQIVAFPQDGLYTDPEHVDLYEKSLEKGVDLAGAIPHNEWTREDGVRSIKFVLDMAEKYDVDVDMHIDETDDPASRFTEVLVSESRKRELDDRVTASHATAMHSYNNAYASKLIGNLSATDINVITNPLDNSVLQGRYDSYPRRRGHTRIDELLEAGVTVGMGHDSLMDPWYHYGQGDPMDAAFVMLHYAHMSGYSELSSIWKMVTENNASIVGADRYGLQKADEGSLIIWNADDPYHALRTRAVRRYVIKSGNVIARTEPSQSECLTGNNLSEISFYRKD